MSIGIKLKALRLQAGLTQVQLAQASGVQQSVLTRYENDLKTPSAPRLAAVARALGVTVEDILDETSLPGTSGPKLHVHGNSRAAKVQDLFLQLDEETQRVVLKQIKALVHPKARSEPHRRSKAA